MAEYGDESAAGLNLAEVDEAEAPADVRRIFDEIRDVTRVPFVDQLWRVLATRPKALATAWRRVAPALSTMAAERAGAELRREAAIPLAMGLPSHKAFRGDMSRAEIAADDRERVSNYNTAMHYVLPKLLLAAALLTSEPTDETRPAPPAPERLPGGVIDGVPRVEPLPVDARFGQVPDLFAELRTRHGYEPIADYYRSIARAGDFLRIALNALRPVIGDHEYHDRAAAVSRLAGELARDLSADRATLMDPETAAIARFYLHRLLPETLIELTIIKGLTDGPHAATYNRLSLADTPPEAPDFHASGADDD